MTGLKEIILESMALSDYRRYYEQELGEVGKLNSSGWAAALCCFHDDTDPSLNINFFAEGAWKCHGCSESGDLFSFHQKKHGTDFKGALQYFAEFLGIDPANVKPKATKKKSKPKKKKPLGPPSKIYQYINLDGKVRIETCRYDNPIKDFRQRRPHPTKPNEYLWNLKGVEHIPYNLQAVVESDTLYIVEGEKDVDRLAQVGLTATCNPLGAGKWPDSLTPYFKDKTVIILPDNDDPGKQHAKLVAQKLHGTAKSIQIVNLPNLPSGGDVSDWLTAGNTKADLLEVIKNQKPYEDHIDFFNKTHAIIMLGGKCCILNEGTDPIFNRPTVTFSSLNDFRIRYANRKIPNPARDTNPKAKKFIPAANDWIESPNRRQYNDIVFAPKEEVNGYYNLWRGFAIEPKQGDWSKFRNHIFEIIAKKNQKTNDWILTWMARIIQDPGGRRPETALVLRGGQGTGKGIFFTNFGKLFGGHFLHVTSQKQLTSNFNNHQKNVLLLYCDEAWWAGDKSSEGIIRGIITETVLTIEPKGQDSFIIKNYINLGMASNSDWVVPSGIDERRFCVLDISNTKQQNKEYFYDISYELDHGGYEAMMYDLLEYDTSKIDVSKIMNTAAGFAQKIESMAAEIQCLYEILRSGNLQGAGEDLDWNNVIQTKSFQNQYIQFCDDTGVRHRKSNAQLGTILKKFIPQIKRKLIKTNSESAENYVYKWHYEFPSLEICRNSFESALKTEIDWDNDSIFVDGDFDAI